jgi:uncharacterized protein RhaS with RHS repeats
MFSPNLGRWMTLDPIEYEAGDVNLYRYVGNNPIRFVDPDGLQDKKTDPLPKPVPKPEVKDLYPDLKLPDGYTGKKSDSKEGKDPVVDPKKFDPGMTTDCPPKCKSCPKPVIWEAKGNEHGSTTGTHWHSIVWNQIPITKDKDKCQCVPQRKGHATKPAIDGAEQIVNPDKTSKGVFP